jgi:5-methyltetrahydropteroyltriglutamate--homocysteine methyltransferase
VSVRAGVVGSLLRPERLKAARQRLEREEISASSFEITENSAVDEAIELQEAVGLQVITDGELRRGTFIDSLANGVSGIERVQSPGLVQKWHGESDFEIARTLAIVERLTRESSPVTEEFAYAQARANASVKATLPSPLLLTNFWHPDYSPAAYEDVFDLYWHAVELIREDIHGLVALGCTRIQIDAPDFAKFVDHEGPRFYGSAGATAERVLTEGVEVVNSIPVGFDGVRFGVHLCRGNKAGSWRSTGGYAPIAKQVLGRLSHFDELLLEFDDERSGDFAPLREVPDGQDIVLGLITTKWPDLETSAALISRIREAERVVSADRLALSPQCGFASVSDETPMTEAQQQAKLELVVRTAEMAWGL